MVWRKYIGDYKESEMTLIDNGHSCKIPICPMCIKENKSYDFGDRETHYHCKNLYKCDDGTIGQCCMVFKEDKEE